MKKLLLLSVFALLFSIFSCTPDEYEAQPVKKTEKTISPLQAGTPDPDGPGDDKVPPPPPKP